MIGRTFSHYRILAPIGKGGMGVVYKAEDTKLKRIVALKFLPLEAVGEGENRARFEREAQAAAALNHPNVCTIYEVDEADGQPFIAMEFVEGETLAAKIESGPLKIDDALDIAIQAARGLAAAHEHDIVHRDVKSANIMVVPEKTGHERQVKLMDFGLAHLANANTQLTKEGTTLGTMSYMAPEQASGEKIDRRADIWALGVVLYEMIAGQQPFQGEYEQAVVYSILNEQAEPLTALRTGVPKELERIAGKALSKDRDERYQHVEEMLVDLRALKRSRESASAVRPPGQAAAKKASSVKYAGFAAAGAVVLIAAYPGLRPSEPAPSEPFRVRPLTSYPGSETSPAVSPDGNRVAFCWDPEGDGSADIYALDLDATDPVQLTNTPEDERGPAWSPDGTAIAFVRRVSAGTSVLAVMPAVGGPERVIEGVRPVSFRYLSGLTWERSGKALIVSHHDKPGDAPRLVRVSLDNGQTETITSGSEGRGDFSPSLSPDGRVLAFARGGGGTGSLFTVKLSSDGMPVSEPQLAGIDRAGAEDCPTWTPDGAEIVFASQLTVTPQGLWRVSPSGADTPRQLETLGPNASCASVFPDGRRLVYQQLSRDVNIWRIELSGGGQAAGRERQILSSTLYDANPQHSPDGRQIVFETDRAGTKGIWVADADGSNERPLFVDEARPAGSPRWSPDGRRVVFDAVTDGQYEVYVRNTAGGPLLRLTQDPAADSVASWSSDGQWVYFGSGRGGARDIWKVSAAGGEPQQVTRTGGGQMFESPDGKWLYFSKAADAASDLWRLPAEGGEPERVASGVRGRPFTVTSRGVYFMRRGAEGVDFRYSIYLLDPSTGRESVVAALPVGVPPWVGLTVSPDGRTLLYDRYDQSGSDLMLVENFQ